MIAMEITFLFRIRKITQSWNLKVFAPCSLSWNENFQVSSEGYSLLKLFKFANLWPNLDTMI